jgi:NAD(P)-dependent dehydrogenase (short-subunit alcohol dehydrogenase family)
MRNSRVSLLVSTTSKVSRPDRFEETLSVPLSQGLSPLRGSCFIDGMTSKQTWFITGAGRGMGVELVRAALDAGHDVVATGRDPQAVAKAVRQRQGDNLLVAKLDITSARDAENAVAAAVDRFGGIDVLVNNAASFFGGFFEELSPGQIDTQLQTNLVGPMNVTRAVLPIMRRRRAGHVITISSLAGLVGQEFCAAYAASKFGLEGWMESLTPEVKPFGITTTIVEPGFFRTELLEPASTTYAELSIDDYAERTAATEAAWRGMNGRQAGDPAKLADALVTIAGRDDPPLRWVAGADAVIAAEHKANTLLAQVDAYRDLSTALSHDGVPSAA